MDWILRRRRWRRRWGTTRHTNSANGVNTGNVGISGGLFGFTYGYNWQSGPLVFGVESDISWSGIKAQFSDAAGAYCAAVSGFTCVTDLRWLGTSRARLGYAWDRVLVYATAGVAYGSVQATIVNAPCCNSEVHTRFGYALGGGLEFALGQPNWTAKVEYLYVNFGDKANYSIILVPGVVGNVHLEIHTVRVGLNYKFGS